MQVNGDKSKLKRNKTSAFKVQVLSPTDTKFSPSPSPSESPPPSAHSSGLQVPTDAASTTHNFRSRYLTMISPRSSNYDRLEGGMGPSRISQRFGWKKFGIVACVLIGLIYLFGPRQHRWTSQENHPG